MLQASLSPRKMLVGRRPLNEVSLRRRNDRLASSVVWPAAGFQAPLLTVGRSQQLFREGEAISTSFPVVKKHLSAFQ